MRERTTAQRTLLIAAISFFVVFAAAPFLCMLVTTFKQDADLYRKANNPFIYNLPPTNENVRFLFENTQYPTFIRNSLVIGVAVVLITLVLAVPAAYALARLTGRWGERAGILIFLVYLIPPTLLYIPMNRIITTLGLRDSVLSLILTYPTISVPFATWLLMGFFKSIPRELEEAALVDGYNRVSAFIRVVMPLSLPGMIAITVFTFTLTLHEFMYALAFVSSSKQRPLSVGVPIELVRGDVFYWQSLLAAAFIVAIPVGIAYNMFLNRLVQGFTMGAVKG
jgi:multiple sugar transport system permease protein